MKIEQMCLDSKRVRAKCWTIANVRDGIKTLGANARPRNVDAIVGHQLFVAREIDSRHSVLRPKTAPAPRCAQNREGTCQQMPRSPHTPLVQWLADMTAGNGLAAQLLLRV